MRLRDYDYYDNYYYDDNDDYDNYYYDDNDDLYYDIKLLHPWRPLRGGDFGLMVHFEWRDHHGYLQSHHMPYDDDHDNDLYYDIGSYWPMS